MASAEMTDNSFSRERSATDSELKPANPKRGGRLTSFWKALIITSFAINAILLLALCLVGGFVITWRNQILNTTTGVQGFARNNVAELRDVVSGLEGATIRQEISLDSVVIPLKLDVPVDQVTTVVTTEDVPLQVQNAVINLGAAGQLIANVNLSLPAGTPLNIHLKMNIPIDQPLSLEGKNVSVPVNIPLKDTELGPEFRRLGNLVDRLAGPAAPILSLDIPEAPPAPAVPTAAPKP